jgi:hypothetical protein
MLQGLFASAQAVVDAAAFGFDVREAQFYPGLELIGGSTLESLLEQSPGMAIATGLTLHKSAMMKLSGR